jgi:hypothetical protein
VHALDMTVGILGEPFGRRGHMLFREVDEFCNELGRLGRVCHVSIPSIAPVLRVSDRHDPDSR